MTYFSLSDFNFRQTSNFKEFGYARRETSDCYLCMHPCRNREEKSQN